MKRKSNRLAFTTLIIMLIFSLVVGCSGGNEESASTGDGDKVTWKLNHIRPADTRTDVSAVQFADDVAEKTEGRVNIDVYANAQLGDYQIVQESVSAGEIDMQLASLGTNVDRTLQVAIAPYLVSGWEEARKLYNTEDGFLAKYLSDQLDKQNIKLLAVYPQYFGSIFLSKEPKDPTNPDASKNLKIRVPSMKSFEEYGKGIGFQVTPLAATEIFTSLQTGVIDGALGGGTEMYYNEYRELGKYVMPINTHFESHYLTVNKDTFNALSSEDQESILAIAKEFEDAAFKQAEEETDKYNKLMEEAGVEVLEFTDEQIQAYADKVRKDVWPVIEGEYGDIFKELKAEVGL